MDPYKRLLFESYVDIKFAQLLLDVSAKVIKEHCPGCVIDHPSQRQHYCVMLDNDELFEMYFCDMLKKMDKNLVTKHLLEEVAVVHNICYECMKTFLDETLSSRNADNLKWTRKIIKLMLKLQLL